MPDSRAAGAVKTGNWNSSDRRWRTVLDPASGAGILIGSICLRDLKHSHTVTQAIQFGSEYIEGLGHDSSAHTAMIRVLTDIKEYIQELISSLFAIDIDETSCVFTRMSLLCCFGPVVRSVQALDMAFNDGSTSYSLPRFLVFCGSSPILYSGVKLQTLKHDTLEARMSLYSLAPLWKRSLILFFSLLFVIWSVIFFRTQAIHFNSIWTQRSKNGPNVRFAITTCTDISLS